MPIHFKQGDFIEVFFEAPVTRQDIEKLKNKMQLLATIGEPTNFIWHIEKLSDFTYMSLLTLTQLGFAHWRGFRKIAILSEDPEVELSARWQNFFVLWQVRCFSKSQYAQAQNWLSL
jgi:hypothetical protein